MGVLARMLTDPVPFKAFLAHDGVSVALSLIRDSISSSSNATVALQDTLQSCVDHAVRSIAFCVQHDDKLAAVDSVAKVKSFSYLPSSTSKLESNGLQLFGDILVWPNSTANIYGNVALCISGCSRIVSNIPEMERSLAPLMSLLPRTDLSEASRRNVATALAKLSNHKAFLAKIKENGTAWKIMCEFAMSSAKA
jgi:hypothetical protein